MKNYSIVSIITTILICSTLSINAQEKLSVINAPKFVASGAPRTDKEGNLLPSIIEERRLKKSATYSWVV